MTSDWIVGGVAAVTGAGSGIGRAMAHKFAREGMRVALMDIDAAALDAVKRELSDAGADVFSQVVNVADAEAVDAAALSVVDRFGTVNIVCNNAGVSSGGLSWEIPIEDWRWTLGVNLFGVVHGIRAFVPHILNAGVGHVVNTASMAGFVAAPAMGPYNASKHAVVGISETLFHELAMINPAVGVSVLCPGWVNTNILNSEVHRPSEFKLDREVDPSESGGLFGADSADAMRSIVEGLIRDGVDPADVADLVFESVEAGRFWIFTHDDWLESAQRRYELAFGGENPQMALPGVSVADEVS